jgi:hypothetical protein
VSISSNIYLPYQISIKVKHSSTSSKQAMCGCDEQDVSRDFKVHCAQVITKDSILHISVYCNELHLSWNLVV